LRVNDIHAARVNVQVCSGGVGRCGKVNQRTACARGVVVAEVRAVTMAEQIAAEEGLYSAVRA